MRPRELKWVALDGGSGAHERPGAGGGDRRGASGGAETAQSDSSSIHVTISPQLGNFAPPSDFASAVLQVSETKLAIEQREIFRDFLERCDFCRAIRLGKRQRSQTAPQSNRATRPGTRRFAQRFRSLSPDSLTGSTLTVRAEELRILTSSTSVPSATSFPGMIRVGAEMRVPLTCVPFVLSRSSIVAAP